MSPRGAWRLPAALTVALMGACGGQDATTEDGGTSAGSGDGGSVSAEEYAADLCAAQLAWVDELQTLNQELQEDATDPESLEQLKEATLGYFDGVVEATEQMVDAAEAAGVPDVADGEEAAGAVIILLEGVRDAVRDARDRLSDLPTDDAQAFSSELLSISSELGTTLGDAASALDSLGSPELDSAMLEIEECQQIPA